MDRSVESACAGGSTRLMKAVAETAAGQSRCAPPHGDTPAALALPGDRRLRQH
ncbi:hypothetical protein J6590_063278, partial [Homalodisca vitripennis]